MQAVGHKLALAEEQVAVLAEEHTPERDQVVVLGVAVQVLQLVAKDLLP
jgi:hypothetical protein